MPISRISRKLPGPLQRQIRIKVEKTSNLELSPSYVSGLNFRVAFYFRTRKRHLLNYGQQIVDGRIYYLTFANENFFPILLMTTI
jgi:hypothetical protein